MSHRSIQLPKCLWAQFNHLKKNKQDKCKHLYYYVNESDFLPKRMKISLTTLKIPVKTRLQTVKTKLYKLF